ncbi:MAG TPA: LacI family DNA-binding transcriptional regulator [Ramlibacter sp.]|nr:LacI family DNA-binding transcriptional regulator [Ramlibacter sp.]
MPPGRSTSRRKQAPAALPTMADVAARAGVSAMTVSRALKDPEQVTDETRRRVTAAVRETGYVPNGLAGVLKSAGHSKLVAAIFPSLQNSLFAHTIQGLADTLQASGLHLMVADSRRSREVEESLVESLLAHRPSAIVLHETVHTPKARRMLARAGIPVVEIGDLSPQPIDSLVSFSNRDAAAAMTNHLLECGYRRIGFASLALAGNVRARHRREGFELALRQAGITPAPHLMLEAPAGFDSGAAALAQLTSAEPKLQAIFFAGDVLATGALLECQQRGWAVPRRLAIASFDDYDIHDRLKPRLTVVQVPRYEIGSRAAGLIIEAIARGGGHTSQMLDLGFRIAAHDSTRPASGVRVARSLAAATGAATPPAAASARPRS